MNFILKHYIDYVTWRIINSAKKHLVSSIVRRYDRGRILSIMVLSLDKNFATQSSLFWRQHLASTISLVQSTYIFHAIILISMGHQKICTWLFTGDWFFAKHRDEIFVWDNQWQIFSLYDKTKNTIASSVQKKVCLLSKYMKL